MLLARRARLGHLARVVQQGPQVDLPDPKVPLEQPALKVFREQLAHLVLLAHKVLLARRV